MSRKIKKTKNLVYGTVKNARKLLTWELKRINRASQDYLAKGLRGFGSRFGDKCSSRARNTERSRRIFSSSTRLRPRLPVVVESVLRTRKTIYFEGRKLHYQAERAQSIMTFSRFAAARQRRAIASSMMIPGLWSLSRSREEPSSSSAKVMLQAQ